VKKFLLSESGAVTVDWTVLAASVVGLGVGTTALVRSGTSALGTDINSALTSASVAPVGIANMRTSFGFDEGDLLGWTGARVTTHPVLGAFLGPYTGSEGPVTHRVVLPDGATSATVTFDLMLLDSWDSTNPVHSDINRGGRGDGVAFTINGTEVGFSAMQANVSTAPTGTMVIGGTTYSYTMSQHSNTSITGQPGHWHNSRWSVSLTATNPPNGGFTLGIDGTTDQSGPDESLGIDNYRITAVVP
jgi:hypothetical protein